MVIVLLATVGYGDLLIAAYNGASSTTDQIALNNTTNSNVAGIDTTASSPVSPYPMLSVNIVSPTASPGSSTPVPGLAMVQPETPLIVTPAATHQALPMPPTVPPMIANDGKHNVLPTPPPVPTISF